MKSMISPLFWPCLASFSSSWALFYPLFLGQQEDRYAIVSFVILCLGCTLFGIGIGKWISHWLHSVLKESKSRKKHHPHSSPLRTTLPNI